MKSVRDLPSVDALLSEERVQALVVQNGNAYDEGIDNDFWKPLKAYWQEMTAEREEPLRGFLNRNGDGRRPPVRKLLVGLYHQIGNPRLQPAFVPDGETRTVAEMSPGEKDAISHRARAARALLPLLGKPGSDPKLNGGAPS